MYDHITFFNAFDEFNKKYRKQYELARKDAWDGDGKAVQKKARAELKRLKATPLFIKATKLRASLRKKRPFIYNDDTRKHIKLKTYGYS